MGRYVYWNVQICQIGCLNCLGPLIWFSILTASAQVLIATSLLNFHITNPPDFPLPHGDIMPGLNSVWETINVISYIQSEIKGLIGCWLRTLWRDVQTQSSGSQSSQASCPTRQKTFSPSRTVDNVDNSASHFNVKIQGRPLISRKRVVWMAVWCGDRDGPH